MLEAFSIDRGTADDVGSVYDAALARRQPRMTQAEPMPAMNAEPQEVTVLPLTIAPQTERRIAAPDAPGADWSATIGLVERAASTIKAYERRFVQLDVHTRALIERSSEEQARLQEEINSLEARLRDSEERATRAEASARDEAFYRWEAERRLRETEARLADAEDYSRQSEDYLRRVHSVLAEL